jgi:hypothetical protein
LKGFDRLKLWFTVQNFPTTWQRLEVGIVTGSTVSVILLSVAMELMVKSVKKIRGGPGMRAFMNDMTISTKTIMRWTFKEIEDITKWTRRKIKPTNQEKDIWYKYDSMSLMCWFNSITSLVSVAVVFKNVFLEVEISAASALPLPASRNKEISSKTTSLREDNL